MHKIGLWKKEKTEMKFDTLNYTLLGEYNIAKRYGHHNVMVQDCICLFVLISNLSEHELKPN